MTGKTRILLRVNTKVSFEIDLYIKSFILAEEYKKLDHIRYGQGQESDDVGEPAKNVEVNEENPLSTDVDVFGNGTVKLVPNRGIPRLKIKPVNPIPESYESLSLLSKPFHPQGSQSSQQIATMNLTSATKNSKGLKVTKKAVSVIAMKMFLF